MSKQSRNLFTATPVASAAEFVEALAAGRTFRMERIVSKGHITPPYEWYDQEQDEWVALLSGAATIRFDSPEELIELLPGDYLLIPARRRHRVEFTSLTEPSVWLAIHFDP